MSVYFLTTPPAKPGWSSTSHPKQRLGNAGVRGVAASTKLTDYTVLPGPDKGLARDFHNLVFRHRELQLDRRRSCRSLKINTALLHSLPRRLITVMLASWDALGSRRAQRNRRTTRQRAA